MYNVYCVFVPIITSLVFCWFVNVSKVNVIVIKTCKSEVRNTTETGEIFTFFCNNYLENFKLPTI